MAHKQRSQDLNPGDRTPASLLFATPHPPWPWGYERVKEAFLEVRQSAVIYCYLALRNLFPLWVSVFFSMKWVQQIGFVESLCILRQSRIWVTLFQPSCFPFPSSLMCFFSPGAKCGFSIFCSSLFCNCFVLITCVTQHQAWRGWISGVRLKAEKSTRRQPGQKGGEGSRPWEPGTQLVGTLLLQHVSLLLASCRGSQEASLRFLLCSLHPAGHPLKASCPQGRSASDPSSHRQVYMSRVLTLEPSIQQTVSQPQALGTKRKIRGLPSRIHQHAIPCSPTGSAVLTWVGTLDTPFQNVIISLSQPRITSLEQSH